MMKNHPIPANGEKPCDCCGRFHRKLYYVDGYWLGTSCAEQYGFYCQTPQVTNIVWRGYEKQYAKVKRMVTGTA
jgi:hypothetical protein